MLLAFNGTTVSVNLLNIHIFLGYREKNCIILEIAVICISRYLFLLQMFEECHKRTWRRRSPPAESWGPHRISRRPASPPPRSTCRWSRHFFNMDDRHISSYVSSRNEKWKVDADFGKAHHMRVTRHRQQRSRRFPGPVISTTTQPHPNPWPIPSHVEHGPWL